MADDGKDHGDDHETKGEGFDPWADLEAEDNDGETPLMAAAEAGKPAVVALLLDRGARLTARDADGRTALHRAEAPPPPRQVT
jgi:hypothetical protein